MMTIQDMVYNNTDSEYQRICDFLNNLSKKDPFMHWESGRMNFWRYNIHANKDQNDPFFKNNVHVWQTNNQEIVGLCISEYGKNDLFTEVLPAYHEIYPHIFHWIETQWANTRTTIEIDVFSEDASKIQRLKKRGFSFQYHFENKRTYDLDQVDLTYVLEPGFTIQAFSESRNFASRVELVQSAFNNLEYTQNNIMSLMASPDYIDAYHLSVISPNGQHVAYCIGWHDPTKEHCGYIEPVGTHAAFRQRGFAKAINQECFKRMKANGIKTVEIASRSEPNVSNFLYDALNPSTKREVHKYSKKASRA